MSAQRYPARFTDNLRNLPGALPIGQVPEDAEPTKIASECVRFLDHLRAENLTHDAIWRDSFALTGTLRTFYSGPGVVSVWGQLFQKYRLSDFKLVDDSCNIVKCGSDSSWIEARFTFRLGGQLPTFCSGVMSLVPDKKGGPWKIWILRTILEHFIGYPNPDGLQPQPLSSIEREAGLKTTKTHYQCILLGGGQSGLATAGRLKALGVDYLIVEKHANIGDNWKCRYDVAKCELELAHAVSQSDEDEANMEFLAAVHSPKDTAQLPFGRIFGPDYPRYLGKDDLARGYQAWADKFGINIWLSTCVESGSWDSTKQLWNLVLRRQGKELSLTADHVVMAVGPGGQIPYMPDLPGRETYKGDIVHSVNFKSSAPWEGKRGVVVGSANTAHDMAEDMLDHGMSVTMLQRGRTSVVPVEYLEPFMDASYGADADIELADRLQYSSPSVLIRLKSNQVIHTLVALDQERFDALERQGFKVDRWGDFYRHQAERIGGHYIDVGASAKIADGRIKVKSDAQVVSYTAEGLLFSDSTEIKTDVIAFATGFYGNMRQVAASIFGFDVADRMEDFWGMDTEGEIYGSFKPSGHPGIWYIGGGTAQCRYFSRFIALQVKAALEGKPLSVYRDTPQVSSPTAVPVPMMAQVEIVLPKGVEVDEASRDMVDPQPQMIIV